MPGQSERRQTPRCLPHRAQRFACPPRFFLGGAAPSPSCARLAGVAAGAESIERPRMRGVASRGAAAGHLAGEQLEHRNGCVRPVWLVGVCRQMPSSRISSSPSRTHPRGHPPGGLPAWIVRAAPRRYSSAEPHQPPTRPGGWGSSKWAPHAALSRKRGPLSRGRAFPTAMAALRVLGRTRAHYGADQSPLRAGCQGLNLGWPASPAPKMGAGGQAGGSTPVQRRATSPR